MEGIFFIDNKSWNELCHNHVVMSRALSEEQLAPSIRAVTDIFLRPALSDELVRHLEKVAVEDGTEVERMALEEARCAALNLALWYNFDELNTHLTDQGWKREEGDSYKSLYHYQELNLKNGYRNKGYNALDRLINILQCALETFPEFASAPAYIDRDRSMVKGAKEIDTYYNVNSSPLVYMSLVPVINVVTDGELMPLVGTSLFDKLQEFLQDPARSDREDAPVMQLLRKRCAAYVICLALARQVETVGSLTERGVYFDSVSAGLRNSEKLSPLPEEERLRLASTLRADANRYRGMLLSYIEYNLPEYFAGRPSEAFMRDNEKKRTFWA